MSAGLPAKLPSQKPLVQLFYTYLQCQITVRAKTVIKMVANTQPVFPEPDITSSETKQDISGPVHTAIIRPDTRASLEPDAEL